MFTNLDILVPGPRGNVSISIYYYKRMTQNQNTQYISKTIWQRIVQTELNIFDRRVQVIFHNEKKKNNNGV